MRKTLRRTTTQPSYARVFAALGDETRLTLVAKLSTGQPNSISQLTEGSRLTRQAITKHLRVFATLLFALGKHLTGRISAGISHDAGGGAVIGASLFELLVAVYGGYFGGGIGIMNLAMLSALGMTDIHAMNKLKVMLGGVINGVATATFILTKAIFWPQANVMILGSVLGGYSTAHYAQKLPQSRIKAFGIVVGTAMTVYFFWRGYR